MNRFQILLLIAAITVLAGCSSIRGERVETGMVSSIAMPTEEAGETLTGEGSAATADLALVSDPAASGAGLPAPGTPRPSAIGLGRQDATASFDFQARELYSGATIDGADLFGQGEVLVTFVQPGCDITVDGGPTIAEIADEYPEAIFVIVHSGADDEAYRAFAENAMLFQENMVHLSDTYGSLSTRYNIDAYPTTLLIDSDKRITAVTGAMDHDAHRSAVETVTTRSIAG